MFEKVVQSSLWLQGKLHFRDMTNSPIFIMGKSSD